MNEPAHVLTVARIEGVLTRLRPYLNADGGDIELVDIDEAGFVYVSMLGACGGCPMSSRTLIEGVEAELRRECGDALAGVITVGE